jgi:SAM-dependent methyltransferase
MSTPTPASPHQNPETWTLTSAGYAEIADQMVPYAAEALRLLPVDAGDRVLDIAAGPGPLSFLAARTAAHVALTDFSEGMIEQAKARAQRDGITNVEARVMNAQALEFPDATFDAAFCMFGFFFFPDRDKAFREMLRVLKPGRRALIATWAPIERRPMMKVGFDAAAEAGLPTPAKGDLQTPQDCIAEMTAAGFRDVTVRTFDSSVFVDSPEKYLEVLVKGGAPLRLFAKRLGPEAWAKVEALLLQGLSKRIPPGGCSLSAEALLTVGTR